MPINVRKCDEKNTVVQRKRRKERERYKERVRD